MVEKFIHLRKTCLCTTLALCVVKTSVSRIVLKLKQNKNILLVVLSARLLTSYVKNCLKIKIGRHLLLACNDGNNWIMQCRKT